jgi:[ribosomal protein S18]-alanine N-acetyltransferase
MVIRLPSANEASSETCESESLVVHLAPMKHKHIRSVMKIESQVYSHPWTANLFASELALRHNRAYTVAQVGSVVVGYSGLMFVGDDAHVTTIAVDPVWQRHKIATRLMLNNARLARQHETKHITLEVRVSNDGAQTMYRKFGFAPAGVRKNYYVGSNEDALVMWANDIDSSVYAERLMKIEANLPGTTIAAVVGDGETAE